MRGAGVFGPPASGRHRAKDSRAIQRRWRGGRRSLRAAGTSAGRTTLHSVRRDARHRHGPGSDRISIRDLAHELRYLRAHSRRRREERMRSKSPGRFINWRCVTICCRDLQGRHARATAGSVTRSDADTAAATQNGATGMKKNFTGELLSGHKQDAMEVPFDPPQKWKIQPQPLWRGRRGFKVKCAASKESTSTAASSRVKKNSSY